MNPIAPRPAILPLLAFMLACVLPLRPGAAPAKAESVDIRLADRLVGRYVIAHDVSSPARRQETYKPFLHLFDREGRQPVTKGPGGEFTHHRGIFIGWMKIDFAGQTLDRWHMIGGEQVVHGDVILKEGKTTTRAESIVHWNDAGGSPFLIEKRTFTFHTPPAPAHVLLDFESALSAPRGDVTLGGDPEHAGIHFRPSDGVDRNQTIYLLPGADTNPRKSPDLPWIAQRFTLDGKSHSVVQFNHPGNPSGTRSSAYRDYGRMGMFPAATIAKGTTLVLRYRFLLIEGDFPETALIQSVGNSFTGRKDPVPAVTRRPVEPPPPPKPKQPKSTRSPAAPAN